MGRIEAAQLGLATTMTATAGWVDAVGFLRLDGLYVSFMSGNTTQMSVAWARSDFPQALAAAGLAILFVMGVFAGRLIADGAGPSGRQAVLSVVAGLLTLAVLGAVIPGRSDPAGGALAIAAMVLAMGAQNVVLARVGPAKAGLTYVTGTLVNLGEALADAVGGQGRLTAGLPYLAMWVGLSVGAAGGAWSYGRAGVAALLIPIAASALLALGLGGLVRRASRRPS